VKAQEEPGKKLRAKKIGKNIHYAEEIDPITVLNVTGHVKPDKLRVHGLRTQK
jgi:hypothetical protein